MGWVPPPDDGYPSERLPRIEALLAMAVDAHSRPRGASWDGATGDMAYAAGCKEEAQEGSSEARDEEGEEEFLEQQRELKKYFGEIDEQQQFFEPTGIRFVGVVPKEEGEAWTPGWNQEVSERMETPSAPAHSRVRGGDEGNLRRHSGEGGFPPEGGVEGAPIAVCAQLRHMEDALPHDGGLAPFDLQAQASGEGDRPPLPAMPGGAPGRLGRQQLGQCGVVGTDEGPDCAAPFRGDACAAGGGDGLEQGGGGTGDGTKGARQSSAAGPEGEGEGGREGREEEEVVDMRPARGYVFVGRGGLETADPTPIRPHTWLSHDVARFGEFPMDGSPLAGPTIEAVLVDWTNFYQDTVGGPVEGALQITCVAEPCATYQLSYVEALVCLRRPRVPTPMPEPSPVSARGSAQEPSDSVGAPGRSSDGNGLGSDEDASSDSYNYIHPYRAIHQHRASSHRHPPPSASLELSRKLGSEAGRRRLRVAIRDASGRDAAVVRKKRSFTDGVNVEPGAPGRGRVSGTANASPLGRPPRPNLASGFSSSSSSSSIKDLSKYVQNSAHDVSSQVALSTIHELLDQIERLLRHTPLGRFYASLCRARHSYHRDQGSAGPEPLSSAASVPCPCEEERADLPLLPMPAHAAAGV